MKRGGEVPLYQHVISRDTVMQGSGSHPFRLPINPFIDPASIHEDASAKNINSSIPRRKKNSVSGTGVNSTSKKPLSRPILSHPNILVNG